MKHQIVPLVLISCLLTTLISCGSTEKMANTISSHQKSTLDAIKNDINQVYGFLDGAPRINRGPCGRFAKLFYEEWNRRFSDSVSISFIMSADSIECYHVLIRLPNGDYYDGGNGILTREELNKKYEPGMYIIDMLEYDYDLLNAMSYGLDRNYERCPNYSDEKTKEIIEKHLDRLKTAD